MSILSNRFLRKAIPAPGLTCIVLIKTVLRKFLSAAFVIYLLFLPLLLHAADDPRAILEKSFHACVNLQGGSFKMNFSKKTFNESDPVKGASGCQFSAAAGDSAFPFKFYLKLKNGDAILCTSNDLVQLKAADSMGVVY